MIHSWQLNEGFHHNKLFGCADQDVNNRLQMGKKEKMVVVSLKMKQYCLGCNQEKLAEYTN